MGVTVLGIQHRVALRKESVDRNTQGNNFQQGRNGSLSVRRAWIEIRYTSHDFPAPKSLSVRRAWIEICLPIGLSRGRAAVALRKESVDRNNSKLDTIIDKLKSLSVRRAWIEMINSM